MGVEQRGKKWVARLHVGSCRHTVGVCGSEAAARACLDVHQIALDSGTSPYLIPGALSIEAFAESIGVSRGTAKRWATEGMPVERIDRVVLIRPDAATAWVNEHHKDTIAMDRRAVVYFVARATDGAIKIGWSSDVARRLGELRRIERCDVELVAAIPGDKPTELSLHTKFANFANDSIGAEWFSPSERLRGFISSLGTVAA